MKEKSTEIQKKNYTKWNLQWCFSVYWAYPFKKDVFLTYHSEQWHYNVPFMYLS